MSGRFTIGQLARAAEVPASTLRYYERIGLLRPDGRTSGNYRYYRQEALERLRFIRTAQENGFRLEDVSSLLDLRDGRTAPCQEVQELIRGRLRDVARRLADLHHVQEVLQASLRMCTEGEPAGRCRVIERLGAGPSPPAQSGRDEKEFRESRDSLKRSTTVQCR